MLFNLLSIFWLSISSINCNNSIDLKESNVSKYYSKEEVKSDSVVDSIDYIDLYDDQDKIQNNNGGQKSGNYNGEYFYYSTGDFISSYFIETLIDYCVNNYNQTFLTYNADYGSAGNFLIRNDTGLFETGLINTDSGVFQSPINVTQMYISKSFFDDDTYGVNIRYVIDFNDINGTTLYSITYNKIGNVNMFGTGNSMTYSHLWNFSASISMWTMWRSNVRFSDQFINFIFNYADNYQYQNGYDNGYFTGYNTGYTAGYTDAANVDATASTIFTGILDVALIPVNVFLTIFNFEVFGINISGIVSALLTVSVVVIIFRFLFGGKKDD